MEFDVFISYSRKDSQIVKQFVSKIETAGYKPWIDKKDISGGDTYQSKIVNGIDNSAIVLFFSSTESNKSQRVMDEICYAQTKNKTIIPVKLDDSEYNEEFILRLNRINSIQYDADQPSSSFEELITSIEGKIGKPTTPVPPKSPEELFELGKSFYVKKDYENAVKYYKPAAEQGHVQAQCKLGCCIAEGRGTPQDFKEAVKWLRKAAEQNDSLAQSNLGYCYHKGLGVTQDDKEAVKWYIKAAEQGLDIAQYNLGASYENGDGVKKDKREAIKWYKKAAEQGDEDAIKALKRLNVK